MPLFAIMRTRPNIQKLEKKIVKVRKAWNDPKQKTKTHVGLWCQKNKKKTKKKKKKTKKILLDFKLSPCPDCCMLSFGWFPGVWSLHTDVSEHSAFSVPSLDHSKRNYMSMKMEQSVSKRRHRKFRRRGITQKRAYKKILIEIGCW